MENIELRVQSEIQFTSDDELLLVEGLVNKTEEWSHLLGTKKRFREKIKSGAFTRAIKNAKVIDFLAEHNPSQLLSSTSNDSLELWEDTEGLKMRARICPTSWGKDTYQLMKSGLLAHMSFGFKIRGQQWKKMLDGTFERTISDLDLIEVSAVRNPAYPQSAISARGFTVIEDIEIDETDVELEERNEEVKEEIKEEVKVPSNDEILNQVLNQLSTLNSEITSLKNEITSSKVEEIPSKPVEEVKEEPVKEAEPVANTEVKAELIEEVKEEVKEEITPVVEEVKEPSQPEQIKEESPKSPDLSSYYKDLLEIYKKGE